MSDIEMADAELKTLRWREQMALQELDAIRMRIGRVEEYKIMLNEKDRRKRMLQ